MAIVALGSLGLGRIGGAEHRDDELDGHDLARGRLDDRRPWPAFGERLDLRSVGPRAARAVDLAEY